MIESRDDERAVARERGVARSRSHVPSQRVGDRVLDPSWGRDPRPRVRAAMGSAANERAAEPRTRVRSEHPDEISTRATDEELEAWARERYGMRALLSCLLARDEHGWGRASRVDPPMARFLGARRLVETVLVRGAGAYVRLTPRGRELAGKVRIPGYPRNHR